VAQSRETSCEKKGIWSLVPTIGYGCHFFRRLLDDLGYVQQSREEMEVLFTFLAERYERRSVVITSNLVFSEWDQIFKDPLTTAAAIDRVVHHSLIIEFGRDIKSYRADEDARRIGIHFDGPSAAQDTAV